MNEASALHEAPDFGASAFADASPHGRRARSLRGRLVRRLIGLLTVAWIVATAFILWRASDEVNEAYEDQALHLARMAASMAERAAAPAAPLLDEASNDRADSNWFVVIVQDGAVLLRSKAAPEGAHPDRTAGLDLDWRAAVARTADGRTAALVGLQAEEPASLVLDIAAGAALPMLLSFAAIAAAVVLAIRGALQPLDDLQQELRDRRPGALTALSGQRPTELQPVVSEINALLDRLADALDQERRFVADASHELRTPLTAIKAQVQTLELDRLDPTSRATIDKIQQGTDRAARLAHQLLCLARTERGEGIDASTEDMDLAEATRQIASELFGEAVARNVDMLVVAETAWARTDPVELELVLRNLTENAIRHAGPNAKVRLSCGVDEQGPWLRVEDDGPCMSACEIAQAFARFRRGENARSPGAGLGLSIVKAAMDRAGGRIQLDRSPDMNGLRAEARFPPASRPQSTEEIRTTTSARSRSTFTAP